MTIKHQFQKSLIVGLCALGLSSGLVMAKSGIRESKENGTVQSFDMNNHTLVVNEKNNRTETFKWNDQTKFVEHGKNVGTGALQSGERVRLTYATTGNTRVLQKVHIAPRSGKHA